jgi:general secretion pathway protein N
MNFHRLGMFVALLAVRSIAHAADTADLQSGTVLENPLASRSLDRLSATRDRPLFAPSRRPPPPPPSAAVVESIAAAPTPPPSVVLLGIVTEANVARALVRAGASGNVVRARLGDEIGGWRVTQIEPRRLVLSNDDRSVSFSLFARVGARNAASRVPPATPPDPQVQNVAEERIDRRSGRNNVR